MFSISTYFSIQYIILLLAAIFFYEILPQRGRRWVLLIFSYLFFYAISGKLVLFLRASTLSVHHIGLWLADIQNDCKKELSGMAYLCWIFSVGADCILGAGYLFLSEPPSA